MESVTWTTKLTAEDVMTGMRIRRQSRPGGRVLNFLTRIRRTLSILLVVLVGLIGLLLFVDDDDRARGLSVMMFGLVAAFALEAVTVVERRAYRRIAEAFGEHEVTIDGSGVHLDGPRGTTDTVWSAYGRWAESTDAFVLLSADPAAVIITVLPKRGLTLDDLETARTLIARYALAGPLPVRSPTERRQPS